MKGTGYWNKRKSLSGRISYRLFGDNNPFKTADELYRHVNFDVAYVMGMSHEALHLARFCKDNNKKFVFRVAHDLDLVGDEFNEEKIKKWAGISFNEVKEIIETAVVVMTQTQTQDALLKRWFDREGELMFPPIDITLHGKPAEKQYDIFWVGKNNVFKRPEKIIELARRLPKRKFCLVLNKMEETSWNKIVAEIPGNVHLVESIPADKIEGFFSASKIFVSTSLHEGFANTFLQAGKNAVPVISMGSDPNAMLSQHHAGVLVGDDMDKLEAVVEELLNNESRYNELCRSARAYVEKFHDREKINKQFYDLLKRITALQV
jgi:glycosyltransferase involved in cell wall biosynthesis